MLIAQINTHLKGWSHYFVKGDPRKAFRDVNRDVQERLVKHLKRRSQRPYRLRDSANGYELLQNLGLAPL